MQPDATPTPDATSITIEAIGELTDRVTSWYLIYDGCGHVQTIAHEGLDDPKGAAFYVRRHYARCLTCTPVNRPSVKPVAAETPNGAPDLSRLLLSLEELDAIVIGQAKLAERLAAILRQIKPVAQKLRPATQGLTNVG